MALECTAPDLKELGVAQEALQWELSAVSCTTHYLHGIVCDCLSCGCGKQLCCIPLKSSGFCNCNCDQGLSPIPNEFARCFASLISYW